MPFALNDRKLWDYETGRTDVPPLRSMWRILHLLGNPWIHNTLVELGRRGMTFGEMRFFLCRDAPKRARIHPKLEEIKRHLSDAPALEFHLPPYERNPQMAGDLRKLRRAGYVLRAGNEWCLEPAAYENLVNEWERESDVDLLQEYRGGDLIRVDHHRRMYGLPRALLNENDMHDLTEIADSSLWHAAAAYRIQRRAKVRAWKKARQVLEGDTLPESISNRILNLFWWWELDVVLPRRMWHPDTPRLISSEMFQIKSSQLTRRRMKNTLDQKAFFAAATLLGPKYLDYSTVPKGTTDGRAKYDREWSPPKTKPEPPFASQAEKELHKDLVEFICNPRLPDGDRAERRRDLVRRGIPEDLLVMLRLLWGAALRVVTLVDTTPTMPLSETSLWALTEKEFYERTYGSGPASS